MKSASKIFAIEYLVSLLLTWLLNRGGNLYDFFFSNGLLNLVVAIFFILLGLILLVIGHKILAKKIFIAGGLILLTGLATCSIFPFKLNG